MAGEIAGRAAPAPVPAEPAEPAVAPTPVGPTDPELLAPNTPGVAPDEPATLGMRIHPADRRMVLALLAVIVVSLALRLLTWNGVADGDHSRYVKTTLFGGAAAAMVWLLIRIQTMPWSRLPLICAAVVLLSGDAI